MNSSIWFIFSWVYSESFLYTWKLVLLICTILALHFTAFVTMYVHYITIWWKHEIVKEQKKPKNLFLLRTENFCPNDARSNGMME